MEHVIHGGQGQIFPASEVMPNVRNSSQHSSDDLTILKF